MIGWYRKVAVILALILPLSTNTLHAREVLDVPATARWKHAATGIILNPVMAGLSRSEMAVSAPMELDIQAQYRVSNGETFATVFIFRPAAGDLALWFDRSTAMITASDRWTIESTLGSGAVALPASDVPGALQAVYATGGGTFRSTAVMLVPMGDWIAKIRMSSDSLGAPELKDKLDEFVRQISWPELTRTAGAVSPVAQCSSALSFGKSAKPIRASRDNAMGNALLGAVLSMTAAKKKADADASAPIWCRDSVVGSHGVYRSSDDDTKGYLLAFGDAGRAASVQPAHGLLDTSQTRRKSFAVTAFQIDRIFHYPDYDRLVPPQQLLEIIEKASPVSSVSTVGDNNTITLGGGGARR
jgi:hypothetical protein